MMTLGHERGGLGDLFLKCFPVASPFNIAVPGASLSAAQTGVLILLGTH